jgi:hypothetical protein
MNAREKTHVPSVTEDSRPTPWASASPAQSLALIAKTWIRAWNVLIVYLQLIGFMHLCLMLGAACPAPQTVPFAPNHKLVCFVTLGTALTLTPVNAALAWKTAHNAAPTLTALSVILALALISMIRAVHAPLIARFAPMLTIASLVWDMTWMITVLDPTRQHFLSKTVLACPAMPPVGPAWIRKHATQPRRMMSLVAARLDFLMLTLLHPCAPLVYQTADPVWTRKLALLVTHTSSWPPTSLRASPFHHICAHHLLPRLFCSFIVSPPASWSLAVHTDCFVRVLAGILLASEFCSGGMWLGDVELALNACHKA